MDGVDVQAHRRRLRVEAGDDLFRYPAQVVGIFHGRLDLPDHFPGDLFDRGSVFHSMISLSASYFGPFGLSLLCMT